MKALLWNVQWNTSKRARSTIVSVVKSESPQVACFTEATDCFKQLMPEVISSTAEYGYATDGTRRKVWLGSTEAWHDVEFESDPEMPPGRFVSGVTHGVRFVGVCVPWFDPNVSTGQKNRKRWEDHVSFLKTLGPILQGYATSPDPICLLGDFNQRVPATSQNANYYHHLIDASGDHLTIRTEGIKDVDGFDLIDHVAASNELNFALIRTISRNTREGPISDHPGIVFDLTRSNRD